jgi:hypothetical protein
MPGTEISGVLDVESPEWGPLLNLVGEELVDAFMWMYEVELEDGVRVHVYKHRWTRASLHLDAAGRAYYYTDSGRYRRIAPARLLEAALRSWWERLDAGPEETAASWAAIERAARLSEPGPL